MPLNIKGIVLHCSASRNGDLDEIRSWHTLPPPRGNGWADVGYHGINGNGVIGYGAHYLEELDGRLQQGREYNVVGAHCAAHNMNRYTIGLCNVGTPGWIPDAFGREEIEINMADAAWFAKPELAYLTHKQIESMIYWTAKNCKRFGLDPMGTFKTEQGYVAHVISQHSDHDPRKPFCASLNVKKIREAVKHKIPDIKL